MMEVVVTTEAIICAKLQSNCHHQQINTQLFTGRMPFMMPNQQCQSTEGKSLCYLQKNILACSGEESCAVVKWNSVNDNQTCNI